MFVACGKRLLVFLQGNDITLVARQPWQRRQQGGRETQRFQLLFREVGHRSAGDLDNIRRPSFPLKAEPFLCSLRKTGAVPTACRPPAST